jgi:ABC-2 type transport system ATP-binding protein
MIVRFANVSYAYRRRRHALVDLSFEIDGPAKVVGLFGPNGAGKTTLIRCMAGLINRYEGSISLGEDVRVAFLPDRPVYYGFLTLDECIELACTLDPAMSAAVARESLDALELDRSTRVAELSRGMSEQLHLALTLARRCRLVVLDEPLASVDPLTRDKMVRLIQARPAHDDSVVIISTHLISGLQELFDELLIVDNGRLVAYHTSDVAGDDMEAYVKGVLSA